MKGAERLVLGWVLLLLLVVMWILLAPLLPWSGHRILHSPTAAAWAQTAGTVAAMFCGAGAIAWQVRFETRREARRELQRDLRAAQEIEELVALAARHLKRLRVVLHHAVDGESVRHHILDLNDELTWHELQVAFNETVIATIPGARLKLAFIRARSGYNNARATYDVLWQEAHGTTVLKNDARVAALAQAAELLNAATVSLREVVQIITRLIEET